MSKKLTNVQRQTFLTDNAGEPVGVAWYVKTETTSTGVKYADAEFRIWNGSDSLFVCTNADVIDRAIIELKAYVKALRKAEQEAEE